MRSSRMMYRGSVDFSLGGWPCSLRWSCLEQGGQGIKVFTETSDKCFKIAVILYMSHRELRFCSVDNEDTPQRKKVIIVCILLDHGSCPKESRLQIIGRLRADGTGIY